MKPRNTLLFTEIYSIIGILEIIGEMLRESGQTVALVYTMKPLLMPVLIGWMLANRDLLKDKFRKIILISLVFSMWGDIFLMFLDELLFIFGYIKKKINPLATPLFQYRRSNKISVNLTYQ